MTIGDILAIIAAVMLAGASWGATIIMAGLLFPAVVGRAENKLTTSPGRCFWQGLLMALVISLLAIAIGRGPGPMRLVAFAMWAVLAVSAAVGSAAIVRIMADRIGGVGSEMTPFARLTRAAALYVGSGFVPIVGWFLITPVAAIGTIGAGIASLRRPKQYMAPSNQTMLPWHQGDVKSSIDTPLNQGDGVATQGAGVVG